MTRALTSAELARLRAPGQWCELYLAILKPETVMACQVNQTFDTPDEVLEVAYDSVTAGSYTDVQVGMTCYVGSTPGAYDLGMVRIRKTPSASFLYIGETSEVPWANNLYLTVVNEFNLWPRHLAYDGGAWYMDGDLAYSDQHAAMDPVPVLGPLARVFWLDGEGSFSPDASASWTPDGSTITAYAWNAPGASAIVDEDTAHPVMTYDAPGVYWYSCTLTTSAGKSATGYRVVFIYAIDGDGPISDFTLNNCAGDYENGGWSFEVTLYDQAAIADVRDRALCVLFANDWFGEEKTSIGPAEGFENVIAVGWIDEEALEIGPDYSTVTFTVEGPAFWLSVMQGYSTGLKDATSAPSDWLHIQGLTVDLGMWHMLHWRSTVSSLLDVQLTGDTRRISVTEASAGSLWDQLKTLAAPILAAPCCDRYGRLYVSIEQQVVPVADRDAIPIVQAITAADWTGRPAITRRPRAQVSMLEVSGVSWSGTNAIALLSRAPGNVMGQFGSPETQANLSLVDQDQCNALAGNLLAWKNNPYPAIDLALAGSNRMVDIAPSQYVSMSLAAGDTPRGIVWTDKLMVPRRVGYQHENGWLSVELELEGATSGTPGVTYYRPSESYENVNPYDPGVPDYPTDFGDNTWFPPFIPGSVSGCTNDLTVVATKDPVSGSYFIYRPCTIQPVGAPSQSYLTFRTFAISTMFQVYAINAARQRILTATVSGWYPTQAVFAPAVATKVAGFEIVYLGSLSAVPGNAVDDGEVAASSSGGVTYAGLTAGSFYSIESTEGPFHYTPSSTGYGWQMDCGYGWDVCGTYQGITGIEEPYPEGVELIEATDSSDHTRAYFRPIGNTVKFRVSDSQYNDNSGLLGYVVRLARSAFSISDFMIHNVCP